MAFGFFTPTPDFELPHLFGEDRRDYGREISREGNDLLDGIVEEYLLEGRQRRGWLSFSAFQPVHVLELACASGDRARKLAKRCNAEVLGIDIRNTLDEVVGRDRRIRFMQGDISRLADMKIPGEDWKLFSMRSVAHFMDEDQLSAVISYLPRIAKENTHFAMSYDNCPEGYSISKKNSNINSGSFTYRHEPYRIYDLLMSNGYEIKYHQTNNCKPLGGQRHTYFAKVRGHRSKFEQATL